MAAAVESARPGLQSYNAGVSEAHRNWRFW